MTKTIITEVEVEVDLEEFDTADLLEELQSRGDLPREYNDDYKAVLESIFQKRRLGQDYQPELGELIYLGLGRML